MPPAGVVPALHKLREDVQDRKFVQRRLEDVKGVASTIYTQVGSRSPLVKRGLDAIQKNTAWISEPLVSRLSLVSSPVITQLDSSLADAYKTIDGLRLNGDQAVTDEAAQPSADDKLDQADESEAKKSWIQTVQERLATNAHLKGLREQAAKRHEQFHTALDQAKSQLRNKTIKEFVSDVKGRLGVWDASYVEPTRQAYLDTKARLAQLDLPESVKSRASAARERVQNYRTLVIDTLEKTKKDIETQVTSHTLYAKGMEKVNQAKEQGNQAVESLKQRVESTKARLAGFYSAATSRATEDAKALRKRLPTVVVNSYNKTESLARMVWSNALQLSNDLNVQCQARLQPINVRAKAVVQYADNQNKVFRHNLYNLVHSTAGWTYNKADLVQQQTLVSLPSLLAQSGLVTLSAARQKDISQLDDHSKAVALNFWRLITFQAPEETSTATVEEIQPTEEEIKEEVKAAEPEPTAAAPKTEETSSECTKENTVKPTNELALKSANDTQPTKAPKVASKQPNTRKNKRKRTKPASHSQ